MQNEITGYVYSLVNRLAKFGRRQFGGDDICGDLAMMGLIVSEEEQKPIRMTDISRRLMISKPAATQAIDRLVEKGLVERIRDEEDRRVVYIQATQQGIVLFDEALNDRLGVIQQAIDRIGMEKAHQLGVLLDEFVDALVSVSEG